MPQNLLNVDLGFQLLIAIVTASAAAAYQGQGRHQHYHQNRNAFFHRRDLQTKS